MTDPKKLKLGPVLLMANPVEDVGMAFCIMFCNRSWTLLVLWPKLSYTRDVVTANRIAAGNDPAIARASGLYFPAHGAE